ncbi:MAG: sigma-54-dependent Fis family transcriptional regulator [Planctomycetes bacterium]|nr:sigma-54-dependent Fis family transcriptional regulator [Planctomycetota bacterium]MCB9919203.1 sigma-54-dependent Fis family transcriptional regulator [Planctomycetota bacterium]
MKKIRVLFVDDDDVFRRVIEKELVNVGFDVDSHASAEGVLKRAEQWSPDVALVDLKMPGEDGMSLLSRLVEHDPALPVIMLTGHGAVPEAVEAMRRGGYDFLTKPVPLAKLEATIRRASERADLVHENQRLRRAVGVANSADTIVGDSAPRQALRDMIARVAPTDASVLIEGESGTGKELVARSIHASSSRSNQSLIVVNAAAIPTNLVESELFGHTKGAFTGADKDRLGLFEAASGGTIFLDEIGELPLEVQALLLRALQFGEIRPVGSAKTRTVDVRVIAATNRSLLEEIEAERFRQDLYYRLAAVTVRVPALRECRGDIPQLVDIFIARNAAKLHREVHCTAEAMRELQSFDWPGNVRELENVVSRLCILSETPSISVDTVRALCSPHPAAPTPTTTLRLDELEKATIISALERFDGNKTKVAEALGIALKTLYNKLDRYDLRSFYIRSSDRTD